MLKQASELFSGRWQIPLALVATAVAGVTLYRMTPAPPQVDFTALLADVELLAEAGDTQGAADSIANMLEVNPPFPSPQRAILHDRLAELIFDVEHDRDDHSPQNVDKLRAHQRAAWNLGLPLDSHSMLRYALAQKWAGSQEAALRGLRRALDEDLSPDDRRDAVRATVQLLEKHPSAKLERRELLDGVLNSETSSEGYYWWALRRSVEDALDESDTIRAGELLAEYGERLKSSDLKGYLDYLWALTMVHEGRTEEAAPLVRWIDDWLGEAAGTTRELDRLGHLPSLNRWLMGRIHLIEDRPQDALVAFDEAALGPAGPDLRIAVAVGRGLALAALDRHVEARAVFGQALEELQSAPEYRQKAADEFREALATLYEQRHEAGDYRNALVYLSMASDLLPDERREEKLALLEQVGQAYRLGGEAADDAKLSRQYFARAGEAYEHATDLVDVDESRLRQLLWDAAGAYDLAGRVRSLRRVLEKFVEGRGEDPRMPQALLQLGSACEIAGDDSAAMSWYEDLIKRYPRLMEAARAQVQRARVLVARGVGHYEEAERTLVELLESGYVAPEAAAYRDALLSLCDLLYYQGRYGEAVSRLEDFLSLYPEHPERIRARFMLADAYRRSAYALRDEALRSGAPAPAAESRRRFELAAGHFGELLRDPRLRQNEVNDEALALYGRLALFYQGDCLFELNEPATLEAALGTYRNAAARYAGEPAALTAQIQIANIHLRLGEVVEAARAVERARWLARSIPDAGYQHSKTGDRADWNRFLEVVSASDLFRDAFVAPR